MNGISKMKRTALFLLVIVGLLLLQFVYQAARGFFAFDYTVAWDAVLVANYAIGILIELGILVIALCLLFSVRRAETPFSQKNIKLLKVIAVLLIVYEPISIIMQMIVKRFHPIVLPDGSSIVVRSSLGGIVAATGLAVYCISLVFQYGISLQEQVDETL